ncbi:MAG: spore germination protein [Firmicutes bacterium]|nr:spore germination protein [Bacillota bacterium]
MPNVWWNGSWMGTEEGLSFLHDLKEDIERLLEKIEDIQEGDSGPQGPATSLEANNNYLKQVFKDCSDVVFREVFVGGNTRTRALVVYCDGMVEKTTINEGMLKPLMIETSKAQRQKRPLGEEKGLPENQAPGATRSGPDLLPRIKEKWLAVGELKETSHWETLIHGILSGDTAFLIDGSEVALLAGTRGFESRDVTEPVAESVVKGPREGFTENIRTSTSLLRRRVKDPNLKMEPLQIGRITKTHVIITYIKGIADDKIVEEVRTRLKRIDIDGILESGYIVELIEDCPYSPYPQIEPTERPDKVAAGLLEGRVAILVDNTPYALLVPTVIWQFIQSAEDYYDRPFIGSFLRWIRLICVALNLALPSFYIALTTIQPEMIPTPLIISIAGAKEGTPFPLFFEVLIMEVMFEILREAGVRLPRPVGQAVSIVGALVIGEAAIRAGLASPATVIVVAITGITSFAVPGYTAVIAPRLLRFPLEALAASLGLFGITVGIMALLLHLASLRSFGVPYLSPVAPGTYYDLKDVVIRAPWWTMLTRPRLISSQSPVRQRPGMKPVPPAQGRVS